MICSKCGNVIPDDAEFCPVCGASQRHSSIQVNGPEKPVYVGRPAQVAKRSGGIPIIMLLAGLLIVVAAGFGGYRLMTAGRIHSLPGRTSANELNERRELLTAARDEAQKYLNIDGLEDDNLYFGEGGNKDILVVLHRYDDDSGASIDTILMPVVFGPITRTTDEGDLEDLIIAKVSGDIGAHSWKEVKEYIRDNYMECKYSVIY